MDEVVKLVAKYALIIPVLLTLYAFLRLRNNRQRVEFVTALAIGGALALGLAKLGGRLISDPRPFVTGHFTPLIPHAADNGFPSDHTLLSAYLGFFLLRYTKTLGWLTLAAAACIGAARIAAGVHHLEDIIGSFIIAGLAAAIIEGGLRLYTLRQKREQSA